MTSTPVTFVANFVANFRAVSVPHFDPLMVTEGLLRTVLRHARLEMMKIFNLQRRKGSFPPVIYDKSIVAFKQGRCLCIYHPAGKGVGRRSQTTLRGDTQSPKALEYLRSSSTRHTSGLHIVRALQCAVKYGVEDGISISSEGFHFMGFERSMTIDGT